MKLRRWGFVTAATVLVLVAPAFGQGKTQPASLGWSLSRAGAGITSYNIGAVAGGSSILGLRLGNSSVTKSGQLAISLQGSSAFSITLDHCTGKNIGRKLSCWVGVTYAPLSAPATDLATLTAIGEHGAAASLSLYGCSRTSVPGGHVYWVGLVGAGTVSSVPRSGGCVTTLATDQYARAVAVDSANVYWVAGGSSGTVKEVPIGGGSVTTLATGQGYPVSVATDGKNVYWADELGTVNKVPVGGGRVTILATGQNDPYSVAVDDTHVYWVNTNYGGTNGTVNDVPLDGGSVTTLATGQNTPLSVATDGKNVYWTDERGGTVNEVPIGGGSVTTLAIDGAPEAVATDGTNVYWVDGGARVFKVPVGGGSQTLLATTSGACCESRSVAVDGTDVYWVNDNGTVNKVPIGGGSVTTLANGGYPGFGVAVGP